MATKIDFDFVDRAVDKIDRVDSQLTTRSILSSARASWPRGWQNEVDKNGPYRRHSSHVTENKRGKLEQFKQEIIMSDDAVVAGLQQRVQFCCRFKVRASVQLSDSIIKK